MIPEVMAAKIAASGEAISPRSLRWFITAPSIPTVAPTDASVVFVLFIKKVKFKKT